jgi:hypothetical protein
VHRRGRLNLLPLAAAAYGLGCAIVLSTLTIAQPHPGQLPGAMLQRGLDARIPMRMMLLAIAGPFLAALLLAPLLKRFEGAQPWARIAAAISLTTGLWIAVIDPSNVLAALFVPLVLTAASFLARSIDARFTRRDLILVPSAITLFASLSVLPPSIAAPLAAPIAMAIVVAIRLAVRSPRPFLLAPAALLLNVHAWFPDAAGYLAAAIVVTSPFLLKRAPRGLLVHVSYPLFALALIASMSVLSAERAPRLDIFEDGHWLMPANEMLHGATPYRDTVPGHGFVNDGLLEYLVMRLGAENAGSVLFVRHSLAMLLAPALYAVALALTASGEVAMLTVVAAAAMMLTGTSIPGAVSVLESNAPIRTLPALFALAYCIAAVRRRDPRPFILAGALAVLATLTSVDFGAYAFLVIAVAIVRFGPNRKRATLSLAGGAAAFAALCAVPMLITGCLLPFLRVTLFEISKLTEPYALQFFYWPPQHEALVGLPDFLAALFIPRVSWIVIWGLIAIGTAAAFAAIRPPHRLADPMIVAGSWVVFEAISFGERAHAIFMPVAMALIVASIYAVRWNRTLFAAAVIVLAVMCTPTQMLLRYSSRLRSHGPITPELLRYDALPRARGAWIDRRNVQRLALLQFVASRTLGPGDTFFDFANMPGLHYLLDRRNPIRHPEAPFYETEALQHEVIDAIDRNPRVKLALVQFTNRDDVWIDGVPNAVRAPLVAAYLRDHFRPFVARDGVEIWLRNGDRVPGAEVPTQ